MHDLILTGGQVHDGFANPPITADVAVSAGRVTAKMIMDKLAQARRQGVDVRGDQYPCQAFATALAAMLPPEACEGGIDAMRARLADPTARAALPATAEGPSGAGVGLWRELHPEDLQILEHTDPEVAGRTLAQVLNGREPWDALCDLLIADPHASTVCHTMHEDDVLAIMADPLVADRGRLGPGAAADLVVFDAAAIGHAGTYEQPAVRPTGIVHVLLEGEPVIVDGEFTGVRRGRMLRSGRR